MTGQQPILTDEEAERELEEAEKEFFNKQKEESTIKKVDNTPLAKDILVALGFTRYDNREKGIAYKIHVGPLQIGRTYSEKYPIGNMWVRCLKDCEYGKAGDFPKRDECKKIPLVALFYKIRDGELPIPESTVIGKVVGKSEKAVQIQFEEFGQRRIETWGFGALKKTKEGTDYIPASYSKETEHYSPKMQVPRDIILENYEVELEEAPLTMQTDTTEEKDVKQKEEWVNAQKPEDREREKTEHITMDKVIKREPTDHTEPILKYIDILAEVTERVFAEDRIPSRQKGYSIKYVFDEVMAELKNSKGDNHEGA